jgi:YggT family protein
MSWFVRNKSNVVWKVLFQTTEPFLSPLRRILPKTGPIDLAPLVAVVVLQLLSAFLSWL